MWHIPASSDSYGPLRSLIVRARSAALRDRTISATPVTSRRLLDSAPQAYMRRIPSLREAATLIMSSNISVCGRCGTKLYTCRSASCGQTSMSVCSYLRAPILRWSFRESAGFWGGLGSLQRIWIGTCRSLRFGVLAEAEGACPTRWCASRPATAQISEPLGQETPNDWRRRVARTADVEWHAPPSLLVSARPAAFKLQAISVG
ncbi:hypothetical protein BV20DRAFT_656016 [Pilatotrama ljubarskyi]|nr:hypothetical protein BV20DRAFT_656016 [Pilatotrama ljubarskyi]